jgi:outer membrane protein assembly factor BamB
MKLLALIAAAAMGATAPVALNRAYRVAWKHTLIAQPTLLEFKPRELGGPAVDPATRIVIAGTRDGSVQAFYSDGRPLWHFAAGGAFVAPPHVEGDTVYLGSVDGNLYALDRGTGAERWRYFAREQVASRPVVAKGLVYFSTLQDTVFAVDAKTGAWKWHHRRENSRRFTIFGQSWPTVVDGVVYAGYSDGTVAALDAATGAVRWERNVAPAGDFSDVDSMPQVAGGRVYVTAYSGAVLALDAAGGQTVWELRVPGACRAVLAGPILLVVTVDSVVGILASTGKQLWSIPLEGTPAGQPEVVGAQAMVPNSVGMLLIDLRRGQKVRLFNMGTGVSATLAGVEKRIYVLTNGGDLVAVDLE